VRWGCPAQEAPYTVVSKLYAVSHMKHSLLTISSRLHLTKKLYS